MAGPHDCAACQHRRAQQSSGARRSGLIKQAGLPTCPHPHQPSPRRRCRRPAMRSIEGWIHSEIESTAPYAIRSTRCPFIRSNDRWIQSIQSNPSCESSSAGGRGMGHVHGQQAHSVWLPRTQRLATPLAVDSSPVHPLSWTPGHSGVQGPRTHRHQHDSDCFDPRLHP